MIYLYIHIHIVARWVMTWKRFKTCRPFYWKFSNNGQWACNLCQTNGQLGIEIMGAWWTPLFYKRTAHLWELLKIISSYYCFTGIMRIFKIMGSITPIINQKWSRKQLRQYCQSTIVHQWYTHMLQRSPPLNTVQHDTSIPQTNQLRLNPISRGILEQKLMMNSHQMKYFKAWNQIPVNKSYQN